jgi:hypothetical protein
VTATQSGDCYDCAQIGRKSPAERVVKGTPCCDFYYRQRMGVPMLANQRYPLPAQQAAETTATSASVKEELPVTKKLCKCGCGGEMPPGSSWSYLRGHKPKTGAPAIAAAKALVADAQAGFAGRPAAKGEASVRGTGGHFTIKLSEGGLDAVWNSLSAERKAELLGHLV